MLTLRERKKRDKAARIQAAARAVFHDKGYRTATMREVAEVAGVATGTLFLYASDKRDLLILTVIDDLDHLTEESAASVRAGAPFLEQLLDFFRPRYAYWSSDRRLALTVLQEVQEIGTGYPADSAMGRYQRHRDLILTNLTSIVAAQQAGGHIAPSESPATLARLINLIYGTSVRYWLRGEETPVIEDGIAVLRDYLRITLAGIAT